jgi:hypothetical protein
MVLITIELCPKPETLPGGDKIVTCTVKNLSDYDTLEYTPTPPPTPPKHKLTISVGEGNGTTSPAPGTYEYDEGSTVSVTAYPAVLYAFDHWTLDGSSSTANPITVTMDRDHTLVAYFKSVTAAPKYTLNISSTGGRHNAASPGSVSIRRGFYRGSDCDPILRLLFRLLALKRSEIHR